MSECSVTAKLLYCCETAELLPCLDWCMSILKCRYEIIPFGTFAVKFVGLH